MAGALAVDPLNPNKKPSVGAGNPGTQQGEPSGEVGESAKRTTGPADGHGTVVFPFEAVTAAPKVQPMPTVLVVDGDGVSRRFVEIALSVIKSHQRPQLKLKTCR